MTLYYQEYADKSTPLMVFLHGGGVSGWMWDEQITYFIQDYHSLVPDLPEHGKSVETITFSIKSSAEAIINLIEEKALNKKVILIGFSLGAQIAIQILSMKPDLINYAAINSALVRPMSFTKKFIRPTIKLSYPLIKQRWFAKLQAKTLYINEENFEKYYREVLKQSSTYL